MSWFCSASEGKVKYHTSGGITEGFPITVACWFNASTENSMSVFSIGNDGASNRYVSLEILAAGICRTLISGGGTNTTTNYVVGQWHHLCSVSYNATSHHVFFDGVEEGVSTSSRTLTGLNNIGLGFRARSAADAGYDGRVAEPCIWKAGLSAQEVAEAAQGKAHNTIRFHKIQFYRDLLIDLHSPNIAPAYTDRLSSGGQISGTHPLIWGRHLRHLRRVAILVPQAVGGVTMPRFYHHYQRNTG